MNIQVLASGSSGNAYVVSVGGDSLLLEAGIRFKELRQRLSFGVNRLTGALITHEHGDHAMALAEVMKAGVDCYMSQGTAEALGVEGHRAHRIVAHAQFQVGGCAIMPFDTVHDAAEPLGFLIAQGNTRLLYATDTAYIPYRFRGLTHIMIEVNYSLDILRRSVRSGSVPASAKRRVMRSHMGIATAVEFFKANDMSRVQEIYLLHLSDGNSDAAQFKRVIQGLTGKPVMIA